MRLAAALLSAVLLALPASCGESPENTTSVRSAFEREQSCKPPKGASRWGCSVGSYRCQGVITDRGSSVSCARPGRSIAFTIPR